MDIMFSSPPTMFGFYHIAFLTGIVAVTTLLFFLLRRKDEKTLIRFIWIHGVIMILLEVWKQWFSAKYVYPGIFSMWYFPWQLCDIAMYCSFILPFVKGKVQDAVLVFLSSFSLLAAIMALIVPGDMLRPQILLFMHDDCGISGSNSDPQEKGFSPLLSGSYYFPDHCRYCRNHQYHQLSSDR